MFKFVILVASCLAAVNAGVLPVAYSGYAAPVAYSSPTIVKTALPAAVSYSNFVSAPAVSYSSPTIVKTAAPLAYAAAPVAYASPAYYKTAAPVAYSAYSAHPAPLAYSAPLW